MHQDLDIVWTSPRPNRSPQTLITYRNTHNNRTTEQLFNDNGSDRPDNTGSDPISIGIPLGDVDCLMLNERPFDLGRDSFQLLISVGTLASQPPPPPIEGSSTQETSILREVSNVDATRDEEGKAPMASRVVRVRRTVISRRNRRRNGQIRNRSRTFQTRTVSGRDPETSTTVEHVPDEFTEA